jgi:hypothetical protein
MRNRTYTITVILAFVIATNVAATPLDRLFTTAQERAYLDKARKNYKFNQTVFEHADQQRPLKLKEKSIVFNGVVRRDNGKKEIWINGKKVTDSKSINKSVSSDNSILVKRANRKNPVSVRPGQTLDSDSGQIVESYQFQKHSSEHVKSAVDIEQ